MSNQRLLSVDWDFFFPNGEGDPELWQFFDWGHNEGWPKSLLEMLWITRASAFISHGMEIPHTTGEEENFWNRFKFSPEAKLYIADSHSKAASEGVMEGVTEIWNYDAHHDCGYSEAPLAKVFDSGTVDCSDWMLAYWILNPSTKLHVVYPKWRAESAFKAEPFAEVLDEYVVRHSDDGLPNDLVFDKVFIARSGSWSPPWIDNKFVEFVNSCPAQGEITNWLEDNMVRDFSMDSAKGLLEQTETGIKQLEQEGA